MEKLNDLDTILKVRFPTTYHSSKNTSGVKNQYIDMMDKSDERSQTMKSGTKLV